tara:strand:+ start:776 stop:1072 length:297 start_codon:yes stop_codon:yes gene_type:complete
VNDNPGTLNSWKLDITTTPCVEKHAWSELTLTGTGPEPRHRHSSVVINDSLYVWGGVGLGEKKLSDMWRLDYVGSGGSGGEGGGSWTGERVPEMATED